MTAGLGPPAGIRNIAMMRACLVSGRAAVFEETGANRARALGLPVLRVAVRAAALGFELGFDLGLVMGSSEVRATPSAAPLQPRPSKSPGRARPRSAPQRAPSHHSNAPIQR